MRFTDKEFFDWEIEHGLYPGGSNKGFYEVHEKLAKFILEFHAGYIDTHLDLGGGNSPLTYILQEYGIEATLCELNQYSIDLQEKYGVKRWIKEDFTQAKFTFEQKYDFITSIEVFEHIEDEKLLPFIADLANQCKYFLFSSTPHKDTPEFDEQWGHVNIKLTIEWINLFEKNGFELMKKETEYLQNNCIPTTWTLMFKSKVHA
jgi:hypothetical protein